MTSTTSSGPGRQPLFQFTAEELRFLDHAVNSLTLSDLKGEEQSHALLLRAWLVSKLRHYIQVRVDWENDMARYGHDEGLPF